MVAVSIGRCFAKKEVLVTIPQRSVTALCRSLGALGLVVGCALSAPAVLAQSPPALSGNWQLSCTDRSGQVRQIAVRIEQQGSKLTGSYSGARRSGRLSGGARGHDVSLELQGRRRSLRLTGTTDGNTLRLRTAKGPACTATRQ